ncbi:MAG: hypothetical protein Q9217_001972 [Psora testacea]
MFRRLSGSLPKDPEFPADLEELGYHVNEKDQIRSIANPDQEFHYFISKNERVLEVQREAMDSTSISLDVLPFEMVPLTDIDPSVCIRANVAPRFASLGLETTRLPLTAGPSDPHIPILVSSNISTAKRVLLYFGESNQDLGIFAYRLIGKESIAAGSALNFVSDTLGGDFGKDTALVIANLGQLVWWRRGKKAMTMTSWNALPRKNAVSGGPRFDPIKNRVQGHENVVEHVKRVFEFVLEKAREHAEIDIIGLGEGAEGAVTYLDANWGSWKERVKAFVIGLGFVWQVGDELKDAAFKEFWAKRARAYLIHSEPLDTPLFGRQQMGCNCLSSGEAQHTECIMPRAYKSMLEFFRLVNDVPGYEEGEMDVEVDGNEAERMVKWVEGDGERTGAGITFSMGDEGRGVGIS